MSDETNDPDPFDAARAAARRTNVTAIALLRAATIQVQAPAGTEAQRAATTEAKRLSGELLEIDHVSPSMATYALARSAASVLNALATKVGIDPAGLLDSFEDRTFRLE